MQEDVRKASGLVATAEALQQAQKTLAELETASADLPVLADAYGIVSRILCRPHDTVEAGQPIMELVDMRTQYVTALVPSRDVGRAKPGMKVRLYFPGEQLRHGRIAALPLRTSKRNHAGDSLVEVRIEPTGSLWPTVPVGSTVEVVME